MKKYFTTGLAILLPILLTIIIVSFLVNILTQPFLGTVEGIFESYGWSDEQSDSFWAAPAIVVFFSKMIIIVVLTGLIFFIGFIGKLFLVDYLFQLGSSIFQRLPYVNKIHKACQDVIHSLFSSKSKSFSQVVFVPFPNPQTLSIGLVAKESIMLSSTSQASSELIPVFVPGTPNPSVGFMLLFKKEQMIFANMRIDEAMKFVVSCGVVMPDFTLVPSKPIVPTHL